MQYQGSRRAVQAVIPGAAVNNGSVTCQVIDCIGCVYLELFVMLGATDAPLTTLKLQESETKASATALTGGIDISIANNGVVGTVFGTDPNDANQASVLPTATDDNKIFKFEIDLRGRKRYLLPVITIGSGGTGAYVAALAELSRNLFPPNTAAEKGCAQVMRG